VREEGIGDGLDPGTIHRRWEAAGTFDSVERLRPYPVAGLVGWTLFVWVSRVGLAWSDDSLTTGEKVLGTLPPVLFVALALATAALLLGRDAGRRPDLFGRLAMGFAGFTAVYWVIRLPFILVNDHAGAFKVVHTVLAVVSVSLAVAAWRSASRADAEPASRGQLSSSSAS
jgi:hypothetical protein